MIRVALAQINPTVGDLKGNKKKIENCLKQAKKNKADVLVFPELAVCGYPPEDLLLKEHFVKDNIKTLKQIASKVSGMTVIIGFVDRKNDKLFNAAAVIENKRIKNVYHKQCLPNYGVFDEKRYFANGMGGLIIHLKGVPAAVNICEDIWDDAITRQIKPKTKIIFNISCSPFDMGKFIQRERLMKKRAKETKAYVCYCNLVGGQDELVFDGGSMVIDPRGKVVALAREFEEDLLTTQLYIGETEKNLGKKAKPIYKITPVISRVYKALVLGVRDYARKNGFKKAVLGLSGGIDSSLVAAVAVKALGKNNVIGLTMPSRYSSEGTRSDAKILAANLGVELKELPIERVFNAYLKELEAEFKGRKPDSAEENIQARIRGNFIMALSNKFGWLALTTGNKSEVAVGYCTLYGDMSGGFAVIKDVPKTLVFKLCKHINQIEGGVIPESVLRRPPSAELRANQKDQDSLPAYDELDSMITDYVQDYQSFSKMRRGKDLGTVKKIIRLIDLNEYKRRQAPPGIKITPRAFGKDWRLPITNKYKEF